MFYFEDLLSRSLLTLFAAAAVALYVFLARPFWNRRFSADRRPPKVWRRIRLEEDSTGHSYEDIFRQCMDGWVTEVSVNEPHLSRSYQLVNFVRFCELVVRRCRNVRRIHLRTLPLASNNHLDLLKYSLARNGVDLVVEEPRRKMDWPREQTISQNSHWRTNPHYGHISFNNGWTVESTRGLDIYKRETSKFFIGAHDLHLRQCRETLIDILRAT